MTPVLDPIFTPPCGQPAVSSLCPCGARTQFQVVHLDRGPRSRLLSCEPWGLPWLRGPPVGMTSILVILAA